MKKKIIGLVILTTLLLSVVACSGSNTNKVDELEKQSEDVDITEAPTITPKLTSTITPTATPIPEPTAEPTSTPIPEPTAEPTSTPVPTDVPNSTSDNEAITITSLDTANQMKDRDLKNIADYVEWWDGELVISTKDVEVGFSPRKSICLDVKQIIEAIKKNDYSAMNKLTILVKGVVVYADGKEEARTVVVCDYSKEVLDAIRIDLLRIDDVPLLATNWDENVILD